MKINRSIGGWYLLLAVITMIISLCIAFTWPLMAMWAINNIFGPTIPINFTTWLSLWILGACVEYFVFGKSFITISRKR